MEDGYDPEYLAVERALGGRPGLTGDVHEKAAQYNGIIAGLAAQWPPIDSVESRDVTISQYVTARIYTPKVVDGASQESKKLLPVCVYIHGGGWIAGTLDSEDPQCRMLVRDTPCVVVSLHYRLAPEHKMPAPIEDCDVGFEWAYENADTFNGDKSKYVIIGGSAGGHLALATVNRLVGSGRRSQIQGCVAINPITCHPDNCPEKYKHLYKSYDENGVGTPIVDAQANRTVLDATDSRPDDADVFPVLSPYLKNFPPTVITTCGKDCLRDDGVILELMLRDAGVKVKRLHYEGFPHFFHAIAAIPRSTVMMAEVVEGIHFVLADE